MQQFRSGAQRDYSSVPVSREPGEIVAAGYDAMAERFEEWASRIEGSNRDRHVADLMKRLPERPDILELGCGAGVTSTRVLSERGSLVGVDISCEQIRRARKRLPAADFQCADVRKVAFDDESFDAVVSLYVFNHLPRSDVPPLLERVAAWLRPGGHLLATFSARVEDDANGIANASRDPEPRSGWVGEWLGVEMFFDGESSDRVLEHVRAAGLEIERTHVETTIEPGEGETRFLWVWARRPRPRE